MDIQMEDIGQSEENSINVDDYINEAAFESERCGICMDIVVDRGVLDCCHDWYCFPCIDNWATITNRCPLCNKEFQLITCTPVYDTLGNIDVNEHAIPREDNWCIQEKNSTLSFPSYYINEDAVKCLDGDGCKMRCQNSAVEQDLYMDTSIACDSCDTWYHAFCVGFDPENQPNNSWLCPRCLIDQVPQEKNFKIMDHGSSVDSTFSGRVSVSVADTGETAVVVSMVDIHESTDSIMDSHPVATMERQECDGDTRPVIPLCQGHASQNLFDATDPTHEGRLVAPSSTRDTQHKVINASETPIAVSKVEDLLLSSQKPTSSMTDLKSESEDQEALKPYPSCECVPSLLNDTSTDQKTAKHEVPDGLCMELSRSSESDVNAAEPLNIEANDVGQSKLSSSSGIMDTSGVILVDEHGELSKGSRKSKSPVRGNNVGTDAQTAERDGDSCTISGKVYVKKARLGEISEQAHQVNVPMVNDSLGCLYSNDSFIEAKPSNNFVEENASEDIMSIVQEDRHKSSTGREKTVGGPQSRLRVKKIMRRVGDDSESVDLIQKLKNEIQDAVQKDPSNNLDEVDAIDRKLLAAFRAAIVKPRNEMNNKIGHSHLPVKNMVLKRGKTRESLTKKIYRTANGRRRAEWARDREIEFWKHRCLSKKPEKREALKSVLEILKSLHSSPEKPGSKKELEVTAEKSILSRVYLADTSVFPRKENLKPLSALAEVSVSTDIDRNRGHCSSNSSDACSHPSYAQNLVGGSKENLLAAEQTGICPSVHSKKESDCLKSREVPLLKEHQRRSKVGDTAFPAALKGGSFSSQPPNDVCDHSFSSTADKRKWAMEILARKNASSNTEKHVGKEEDNSMLKSSYPLLAQLPVDMRPVLTVSRHSKVPLSTRQAQLHRLTEFYLQKADLPVVCRSAAAELAVADAINVEQAILDKSISKSVYVNLCSQHIVARKHQKVDKLVPSLDDDSKQDERVDCKPVQTCSSAEEALKLTGLLSDSPPGSPAQSANPAEDETSFQMHTQKADLDSVLDAECNSEIDMRRVSDYGLDEACSTSSSLSKAQNVSNSGCKPVETCSSAEEALKLTGLLSDSPPGSSAQPANPSECEDSVKMHIQKGGFNSVLDAECNSEMNMHRDSDYGLDEACSISSSLSKAQFSNSRSDDMDLKPKVCSALTYEKPDGIVVSKEQLVMPDDVNDKRVKSLNKSNELELQAERVSMCRKAEALSQSNNPNRDDPEPDFDNTLLKGCGELCSPDVKCLAENIPGKETKVITGTVAHSKSENNINDGNTTSSDFGNKISTGKKPEEEFPSERTTAVSQTDLTESILACEKEHTNSNKKLSAVDNVFQKVEAYIKEHIRPLCKSGVISIEQYRWAVRKTAEKVMKYHSKAKNANFLIKEGDKVKRLAEQYVEAVQHKERKQASN